MYIYIYIICIYYICICVYMIYIYIHMRILNIHIMYLNHTAHVFCEAQLHQCDGHGLGEADGCLVQLLPGGAWGNTWEKPGRSGKTMLAGCKTLISMKKQLGSSSYSMICPSKLDRTKKRNTGRLNAKWTTKSAN